jgi:hypothetical protein
MTSEIIDASEGDDVGPGVRQLTLTLPTPQARLRLRIAERSPGRAVAEFEGRSWAAKHYWEEGQGVWVYEFDGALPAGRVVLRVPFEGH